MRPALKAGLLPVWRDRETLQFVDPARQGRFEALVEVLQEAFGLSPADVEDGQAQGVAPVHSRNKANRSRASPLDTRCMSRRLLLSIASSRS